MGFDHDGFGQAVRQVRGRRRLGLREAARQAGIGTSTFARVEDGHRGVTMRTAARVAAWAGLQLDDYRLDPPVDPSRDGHRPG